MVNFYSNSYADLAQTCEATGLSLATPGLVFNWHYKKNQRSPLTHQDLSKKAKAYFETNFNFELPLLEQVYQSTDRTVKFIWKLKDGKNVDSVLIPFQEKYTLCVSSQVGCAMACRFCLTGKQGYQRQLSTDEIIGQFLGAKTWLQENRQNEQALFNVVFMGQGEPLHNFDSVKKACEIMIDQHGLSLAPAKITISTAGYLPGLLRWKTEMPPVNIALSLHSVNSDERAQIIPLEKKYPLKDLLPVLESIPSGKNRFVTYEYLILRDFNDSDKHAEALGALIQGRKAYINLIPFNPFPGTKFQRPDSDRVIEFKKNLESFGIPVTVRTTKGDSILAACGQLSGAVKVRMEQNSIHTRAT